MYGGEERLNNQKRRFAFGTQGSLTKEGRVLIEWVCLDVFVRNSAFLEGDPALLGEWAELLREREGEEGGGGCEYQARLNRV